jgi:hypothetical protein
VCSADLPYQVFELGVARRQLVALSNRRISFSQDRSDQRLQRLNVGWQRC